MYFKLKCQWDSKNIGSRVSSLKVIFSLCFPDINWVTAGHTVWAYACDFAIKHFESAQVKAEQCGPSCESTPECTHFAWSDYEGGTCWMKKGPVTKEDAISNGNSNMVCGIL